MPIIGTPTVRQCASRNTQQPWERLRRNLIQAPPRREKHLRDDIVGLRGPRAPQSERPYRTRVRPIQALKPIAGLHNRLRVQQPPTDYTLDQQRSGLVRSSHQRTLSGQPPLCS
jgi:hypothetical protein